MLEVGEDESLAGDVADSTETDGDVPEGVPMAFKQGKPTFVEVALNVQESDVGGVVGAEGLVVGRDCLIGVRMPMPAPP
ncbi:hypothetical protein [Streptosporangium sp. NPDC049078]|uniref:hypothetical protein n=1 Tax=Streptosporangium sp. NPDC049078 TaxID=3155767 RepID=UPI00344691EC